MSDTITVPDSVRAQWQTGLQVLQPTKAELEEGLAIHYSSLVAESYSIGLYAPVDPDALNREIDAGASFHEFREMLEEQRLLNWLESDELKQHYRDIWSQAGASCLFQNAGEESNDPLRLLKRLARFTHFIDSMPDLHCRVTSVADIRSAWQQGKRSICLTLNGIPLAGKQLNSKDEMQFIRVFAQLGVKAMHLTYNRRNPIGDGCGEPNDGGLSAFGHEVVAELNRLGVMIDLAHTGWKTTLDVCRATTQPVIISHSTAHALSDHIRAKPDEVIQAVVDTGGVFGVTNIPAFLGGRGDIVTFLDHIDYVIHNFGSDGICIGTDRAYVNPSEKDLGLHLKRPPKGRTQWEKLWPANDRIHSPDWQQSHQFDSLYWTNWPLFTVGMVQRGHSAQTIRKVLGENLLRVAEQVWQTDRPVEATADADSLYVKQ